MAVLAVIIPVLLLGVLLALGWYEDLLLPAEKAEEATSSRGPAGTPAASP
ncbi:hypothetical protein SUDANB96_05552 [Streptomyces sp. enrichment culture]